MTKAERKARSRAKKARELAAYIREGEARFARLLSEGKLPQRPNTNREGKTLMREIAQKRHGKNYKFCLWTNGACAYCGAAATQLDHMPALTICHRVNSKLPRLLVPACTQCNRTLYNHDVYGIKRRAAFVGNKRKSRTL